MNKKFLSAYQGIWLTRHPALRLISRNTLRDCYATPAYPSPRSNARKFDGPGKLPLIATLIDSDERGNRGRVLSVIFPSRQNW